MILKPHAAENNNKTDLPDDFQILAYENHLFFIGCNEGNVVLFLRGHIDRLVVNVHPTINPVSDM